MLKIQIIWKNAEKDKVKSIMDHEFPRRALDTLSRHLFYEQNTTSIPS